MTKMIKINEVTRLHHWLNFVPATVSGKIYSRIPC